jgi:hypothetical protein
LKVERILFITKTPGLSPRSQVPKLAIAAWKISTSSIWSR